tara:strand:+ start:288 stop:554 length:267 start_codon:yes stop_codon:yes gene_type:complete
MEQDLNTMLDLILEKYPDDKFLKADGFDEAILGVEEKDMRLIYSVKSCIDILIRGGLNDEEAIDHFYFNVHGAYVGEKTPIWCNDFTY